MQIFRSLVFLSMLGSALFAGDVTQKPQSSVIGINHESSHLYLGMSLGDFRLITSGTNETLHAFTGSVMLGYQLNDFLSIEGRYTRSITDIIYHSGNYSSKKETLSQSLFTNKAVYARLSLANHTPLTPYALLGYGQTIITKLSHANRSVRGLQYGVGLSYRADKHLELFTEWTSLYRGRGFDGRSMAEDVRVGATNFGFRFRF